MEREGETVFQRELPTADTIWYTVSPSLAISLSLSLFSSSSLFSLSPGTEFRGGGGKDRVLDGPASVEKGSKGGPYNGGFANLGVDLGGKRLVPLCNRLVRVCVCV